MFCSSPVAHWTLLGKTEEEKGATEDEMVGWHHQLYGCESAHPLGKSGGQGSLVCCTPWVAKSRTRLNG